MAKQLELHCGHGGQRKNSGRRRIHSKGVAHRVRESVSNRTPLHINFKYRTSIRNKFCLRLLKRAILNARKKGLKIIHFSLQHNHIHLIVESESNEVLTTGMRSLTVTFAMGLKKGKVQIERYHLHVLRSMQEAKNATLYVLFNRQKHERGTSSTVDGYGSLLYLKNADEILRYMVRKLKMTLKIERIEEKVTLDPMRSYLLLNCLKLLT